LPENSSDASRNELEHRFLQAIFGGSVQVAADYSSPSRKYSIGCRYVNLPLRQESQ
jgi:hypothetical protein